MSAETAVPIEGEPDIVVARQEGRRLAERLGFAASDLALIATAISEVARNILQHAGRGEVLLSEVADGTRRGIEVVARDEGPGIPDVERALQDGYSTASGLGLGLPGARRLMDEFEIETARGRGTTVRMRRWLRP
ncbi:MAG TPA: anti-sigma regulatory factor [Actinomycetota bacterium]|nr:anti-sigma regulatory factor [Actinomycetota bacterium]